MLKSYAGPFCLASAAIIWGGMYVVSKAVLTVIPPLELVWLRYIVALLSLVVTGLATRQSWHVRRQDLPLILVIGIIGYTISIWSQFVGTKLSSAQMGAVITSATPAFMVIFARILLKEKLTVRKSSSVVFATIGVLTIVGITGMGKSYLGGFVLGLAALTWALMSVLVKKVPGDYSQLVVTTYAIATATALITPFAAAQMGQTQLALLARPALWEGILYLGMVSTAVAFFLWNKGLQMVDAAGGGLYFFFQPIAGTLLGWLFLGEKAGPSFWIGSFLILGGVFLAVKEPKTLPERKGKEA